VSLSYPNMVTRNEEKIWIPFKNGGRAMTRPKVKDYIKSGLIVSGHSDDIIFVDGDLNAEFYPGKLILEDSKCECLHIAFSDGTLLKFCYDEDGIWRFTVQFRGTLFAEKIEGRIEINTNDVVVFHSGIKWCILGSMGSKIDLNKV
jgi:hypothetical protein